MKWFSYCGLPCFRYICSKSENALGFQLLYLIQKCYTVNMEKIGRHQQKWKLRKLKLNITLTYYSKKKRRKSKLHFTPLLKNLQTNYNLSKCFEMENCNDNFWCAKKLTGKILHLHDSLNIHAYIHIYIHVILKSSGIKSEYLNPATVALVWG